MKTISLIFLLIFFDSAAQTTPQELEEAKIQFLLNTVEKSKITFIRNGSEHTGAKAREHLENKMNYARRAFWIFGPKIDITVENFITKIASRSSTSKKEYKVRLQDGTIMTTNKWLRVTLKNFK